jgi:hypothetical protein
LSCWQGCQPMHCLSQQQMQPYCCYICVVRTCCAVLYMPWTQSPTRAVRSRLSCLPCEVSAWHDTEISMP